MSRFSHYFNTNFVGCRLIAYARDLHRGRDVRIYLMPGHVEDVAVTDGIDKWICPVIANPFSVNVQQLVRNICDGIPIPTPTPLTDQQITRRARSALTPSEAPPPKRRTLLSLKEDPQTATKGRRVLFS